MPDSSRVPRRQKQSSAQDGRSGLSIRWLAMIFLAVILITILLAILFTDITGSDDENGPVDLIGETGCFEMQLHPVDREPATSLSQVEAVAREYLEQVETLPGIGQDDEIEVGELVWSGYGELAPTQDGGEIVSGEAWVLAFEDAEDPSWLDRLRIQTHEYRYSVIVRPDDGEVSRACGARVS